MTERTIYQIATIVVLLVALVVAPAVAETIVEERTTPFVTATMSSTIVARGDDLTIIGTAQGSPSSVKIWIFGPNCQKYGIPVQVGSDGSFRYVLTSTETSGLTEGQYYVVVQHPGSDGFDVTADGTTIRAPGMNSVDLSYLQPLDAANTLVNAFDSPNVGDIYTRLTFLVNAPVPVSGSLDIRSTPSGASVYVDDIYKGVTPLGISEVSAGSHQIKITQSGYYGYTQTVSVTAGEAATISATLLSLPPTSNDVLPSPTTGSLDVRSTPSGANIYIDDTYKGVTPKVISGVTEGSHRIKITRSGYYDYTETNSITAGKTTTVSATLTAVPQTPTTGSLDVRSTPSGGNIYIDGTYKGVTPKVISGVAEGAYQVKVTRSGYGDYTRTTTVTAGKTTTVSATLSADVVAASAAPATGSLTVESDPPGAEIYLDGMYKGVTPKVISDLPPGGCWVTVTKDGYAEESEYFSGVSTGIFCPILSPLTTYPTEPLPTTAIPSEPYFAGEPFTMLWWLLAAAIVLPAGGFIYAKRRRSAQTDGSNAGGTQSSGSPASHDDGQRRKTATEKVIDAVVIIAGFLTCLISFEMLNLFLGLYLQLPVIVVLTAAVLFIGYLIYSRRNGQNSRAGGPETGGSRSPDSPAGHSTGRVPHPDASTLPGRADVSAQNSSDLSPNRPGPTVVLPKAGVTEPTAKPDLTITLSHTSIHADEWDKIELTLVNTGTAHAFDIALTFSNDIDTRLLRPVDLAVGESKTIEAGIRPRTRGKVPLEITARYRDAANQTYKQITSLWLSVESRNDTAPSSSPVPLSMSRPVTSKSLAAGDGGSIYRS
jgi:hypothetical protein